MPRTGQTARAFASFVGDQLLQTEAVAAADIPDRLADAYYRVRFGGQLLPESEMHELDVALKQLREILATSHFRAQPVETT